MQAKLDEESVCQVIDGKLDFIPIFRDSWWDGHYSGVADEDVELIVGFLKKLFCCLLDGAEGRLVAGDESQIVRSGLA